MAPSRALSAPPAPRKSAAIAVLAAVLVFAWTAARVHYVFAGNWTALFCTGAYFPPPPDLASGTYLFNGGGYDGQFYRYLAHDPFLQNGYFHSVDAPQLRFHRILVPLAAWAFALGQRAWIDGAFLFVEMLFLAIGVYWTAGLLARRGRSPCWGLLFVLVPATLASFDRMLVDGPLVALFAGFLLYCDEERWGCVFIVAALAALTRETGLLLVAALVADRLWRRDWRPAASFASAALPAFAWYLFLAFRLPPDRPPVILAPPAWGLVRRLFWLRHYPDPRLQVLLRVTDVLAVLGLAICIVLAACWLLKRSVGPVSLSVALFVALALVLGAPAHMVDAFGFGRPVSPLLLWIMVEAVSRKAWTALVPPLLVSFSVSLVFAHPLLIMARAIVGR